MQSSFIATIKTHDPTHEQLWSHKDGYLGPPIFLSRRFGHPSSYANISNCNHNTPNFFFLSMNPPTLHHYVHYNTWASTGGDSTLYVLTIHPEALTAFMTILSTHHLWIIWHTHSVWFYLVTIYFILSIILASKFQIGGEKSSKLALIGSFNIHCGGVRRQNKKKYGPVPGVSSFRVSHVHVHHTLQLHRP